MQFAEFDEKISNIWFQLTLPSNDINFRVAEFGRQFDISLATDAGENVHIWDLAKLGNGINLLSLELGTMDAESRHLQKLEFQYKII